MFDDANNITTNRTLKNIRNTLKESLKRKYNIDDEEILEKILKIHGLNKEQFDFVNNIESIIMNKLNDVSIDANSNKNEKTIEAISQECIAPVKKAIGFDFLYRQMKKMYGKEEAKRLSGEMYDNSLGLSDSTNILKPYCWSLDASKIVTIGRQFGQLWSKPSRRVSSYISALCESVHQISTHLAGACLYKDNNLLIKKNGVFTYTNIKDLINSYYLDKNYLNYQGEWIYTDINDDLEILENNGNFTKIKKVMKRKYEEEIYEIKTKSGKIVKCSKDHIFKVLFKGREINVRAEDLRLYDTVYNTNVYDFDVNKSSDDYKRGQFLGIICGDGNLTEPFSIRISVNYKQTYISDFVIKYVKEKYNKDCKLNDGHQCYNLSINSIDILNDVKKEISGLRAIDKNIDIQNKSIEYLIGFLDGYLVTDGGYKHSIHIGSINENLIKTVKNICDILNIKTTEITLAKQRGNRQPFYQTFLPIRILKYLSLMKIKTDNSNNKSKNISTNEIAYYGYSALKNSQLSNKVSTYKSDDKNYLPITDVIIEINKFKNDDEFVYEIETESHWYSVGGLLTHNCAIGSFFLDIAHLSLYKEKFDLRELKTNQKFRKKLENEFQQFVHSINHLSRNGAESPFTNISIFDRVKLRMLVKEMDWYFPFDELPINHPEDLETDEQKNEFYTKYVIDYILELQNIFLDFFDKGDPNKGSNPYRFPIITINLSKKKWGDKEIIEDQEFLKSICKREIFRYNVFTSEGTKLASCCRLVNNNELIELGSQVNSFGAGGSISIGSHRVCTVNFNRIALECNSEQQYYEILENRLKDAAKILNSHRELLKSLKEKGLQPFMTNGWININRLFSTIGLLGLYEAKSELVNKFGNKFYEKEILEFVNKKVNEFSKEFNTPFNIEQIPAESFAIRLCETDKLIYGLEKVPSKLYANQFIPLWEDATVWEKMDADGKLNKLISGGSIIHIQISERVTPKQAEKLIKYAVNSGAEHFALNSVWSHCENEHTSFGKLTKCPICGGRIDDYYTRIVGFFTPVSSWPTIRREWEFENRKFTKIPE